MAYIKSNVLVEGFSGRFGSMVFKHYKHKTVVCPRAKQKAQKESNLQRKNRDRFREATMYAQQMMSIPERKSFYQRKAKKLGLSNAYTAAITDYMRQPKISEVIIKGDVVRVYAGKRNFEISGVKIMAFNKSGELVVEGNAIHKEGYWFKMPGDLAIHQIAAVAHDFPGNIVKSELKLIPGCRSANSVKT